MMNGRDLKLRRVALDVTARALAAQMDVPASMVSRWETSRQVTDKAAERYLEALATFGTIPTIEVDRQPIQVMPRALINKPADAA